MTSKITKNDVEILRVNCVQSHIPKIYDQFNNSFRPLFYSTLWGELEKESLIPRKYRDIYDEINNQLDSERAMIA